MGIANITIQTDQAAESEARLAALYMEFGALLEKYVKTIG